jgi:hypothetical protein
MSPSDGWLIIKKIFIGALLVLVPSLILVWGIRLTQRVLGPAQKVDSTVIIENKK